MLQNLTGWHALIIRAVIVLVFGAAKLPALAKSVGQSMRILKSEVAETRTESDAATSVRGGAPTQDVPAGGGQRNSAPASADLGYQSAANTGVRWTPVRTTPGVSSPSPFKTAPPVTNAAAVARKDHATAPQRDAADAPEVETRAFAASA